MNPEILNLASKTKSIKKTQEKELEEAANECTELGNEETPTSGDESDQEVFNKTVKKATSKERTEKQFDLRISIKHPKTSQHSYYCLYNVRTKKRTKKWKQQLFSYSG